MLHTPAGQTTRPCGGLRRGAKNTKGVSGFLRIDVQSYADQPYFAPSIRCFDGCRRGLVIWTYVHICMFVYVLVGAVSRPGQQRAGTRPAPTGLVRGAGGDRDVGLAGIIVPVILHLLPEPFHIPFNWGFPLGWVTLTLIMWLLAQYRNRSQWEHKDRIPNRICKGGITG